jgi:hypothetical protein
VTDDTTPATSEAATEKPADAAPGAEVLTPAPLQGPPPPCLLAMDPGDELGARRARGRIERGEPEHPYAEAVASEQYRSYVNRLISAAGLAPITQPPTTSPRDNSHE